MLRWYWTETGGNILAMPLETAIAVAAGAIFRKPLARAWAWFRQESRHEEAAARQDAQAALRIAADLYRHHTGHAHPHAPGPDPTKRG
jgi:hypothetical protein